MYFWVMFFRHIMLWLAQKRFSRFECIIFPCTICFWLNFFSEILFSLTKSDVQKQIFSRKNSRRKKWSCYKLLSSLVVCVPSVCTPSQLPPLNSPRPSTMPASTRPRSGSETALFSSPRRTSPRSLSTTRSAPWCRTSIARDTRGLGTTVGTSRSTRWVNRKWFFFFLVCAARKGVKGNVASFFFVCARETVGSVDK